MKHLTNRMSALLVMLMCVSAAVQAEIVRHEVCEPTIRSRGFTIECWEDKDAGKFYADEDRTQELVDLALAKAVTYPKLPGNPVGRNEGFSVAEHEHLDDVIDGVNLDLDLNWSVSTTYNHQEYDLLDRYSRQVVFNVTENGVSNARMVWFRNNKFVQYGKYDVTIFVNDEVKYERNQDYGEELEGVFVVPLPGLKKGDRVEFRVSQSASSIWAGGPTFKAALEYTSIPAASIVHRTPCQPTISSLGFTRECWEDAETGRFYADANCEREFVDGELARAVTYVLLRENPITATSEFNQSRQENYQGIILNWAATTQYVFDDPDVSTYGMPRYAEFTVTADDVSHARLVWYVKESKYYGDYNVRIYVNGIEKACRYSTSGQSFEGLFVLPLPGLKKGDVVKFQAHQHGFTYFVGDRGGIFKAALEYLGKFAKDDQIPPLVRHEASSPTISSYGYARECWEDESTGKCYADPYCVEEIADDVNKFRVYAKLPDSPITATSSFEQSESERDWDVDLNWAGVTAYNGNESYPESRWVEFTASTEENHIPANARLVWNRKNRNGYNGLYVVSVYVNDVEMSSKWYDDHWEGISWLPLPGLKKGDIVRFEVKQARHGYYLDSGATFKASLEYNIVPCTHEYPTGSAICSLCGYLKPHTHTYDPVHECTQCGFFDESSVLMSGNSGDNIQWRLFNDWTLYYYGTGEMESFDIEHNAWKKNNRDDVRKIIIGEGITKIGDGEHGYETVNYFGFMSNLTEAVLPSTLKAIGNAAFEYSSLSVTTLPEGLVSVGDHAFRTTKLENIVVPASVTTLGQQAFGNCPLLKSVTLMGAPTAICKYAFYDPVGLKDFYLMSGEEINVTDNVFIYNSASLQKATLHVNNDLYDWALKTSPWNKFAAVVPLHVFNVEYTDAENHASGKYLDTEATDNTWTLADGGKKLLVHEDIPMKTLAYTRNFSAAGQWQALYVPFEMEYGDWADKFDVAAITNFHEYTDENGVLVDIELEARYVKSGRIRANIPYLIRPKEAGVQTITLSNVTLKATEARSISCSSTERRYTFTGTYDAIDGLKTKGYIFASGGQLCMSDNDTDVLKPMRWYLTVEELESMTIDPAPALAKQMSIHMIGEDDMTGIGEITVVSSPADGKASGIYSLTGAKLSKPQRGVNIVDGKKVLVK